MSALLRPSPSAPETTTSLVQDLTTLGVRPGIRLIVHTSSSGIGDVIGGEQSVVQALLAAVDGGTVVVPVRQLVDCCVGWFGIHRVASLPRPR